MMKTIFFALLFLFLLIGLELPAQTQRFFKFNVVFETDKHDLKKDQKEKIKNSLDTINAANIVSLVISGHTDARGDSLYNMELSNRRVAEVEKYLGSMGLAGKLKKATAKGENSPVSDNSSDEGMQKNRRVEILVRYRIPVMSQVVQDTIIERKPDAKDTCRGDTIVTIAGGVKFNVNRCNLNYLRTCVEIETISDADGIRSNGINMRDQSGRLLESGGMFTLRWNGKCGPCPPGLKFEWIISEEEYKNDWNFYTYEETSWGNLPGPAVKKIRIDGKVYYRVELTCMNFGIRYNKDRPKVTVFQKVKVPRSWKIVSAQTAGTPQIFTFYFYDSTETLDRNHVLKTPFTVEGREFVMVNAKTGDTIVATIDQFKARKFKLFRRRLVTSHGKPSEWLKNGFPHIFTTKIKPQSHYNFRKYKLKRRVIRGLLKKRRT